MLLIYDKQPKVSVDVMPHIQVQGLSHLDMTLWKSSSLRHLQRSTEDQS